MVAPRQEMSGMLLGVDWGTSNRRSYLIDAAGACIERHADDQGLLNVSGRFSESLSALKEHMQLPGDLPVVMSGMVGSASGWQEVPYLDIDVPIEALPTRAVGVSEDPYAVIVPGYKFVGSSIDVMRGEEMQLLGAIALGRDNGWMVLPGTHSKWVCLRHGRIQHFSTYMTGELFALLSGKGTLSALIAGSEDDPSAFSEGLRSAEQAQPLSNSLFGVRARVVTGNMPARTARSFTSGLLIGTEFAAARSIAEASEQTVHLIGSTGLTDRYRQAAHYFGMEVVVLDPDQVYLAALRRF